MKLGYHPNLEKDYITTFQKVIDKGGNCVQLFIGSPKSYSPKILDPKIAKQTKKFVKEHSLFVIVHSPYLLNFCRVNELKQINRLIGDINNTVAIGGKGTVLHMGKNVLKLPKKEAYLNFISNLRIVLESTKKGTILLENMCGNGTSICCEMSDWAEFWTLLKEELGELTERVKWCVDTAHLFATGEYNISKRKEAFRFYHDFEKFIGWGNLFCFHYQGSLVDFGKKSDRHADINENYSGKIETKGLRQLARIAMATDKPLIMEVPGETPVEEQLKLVKSWEN